jgi:hypothetical protein
MKKNLLRLLLVGVSFTLFSFSSVDGSKTTFKNPMFGSGEQCMPPIILPGGCTQECRPVTYVFWIAFYGNWQTQSCSPAQY